MRLLKKYKPLSYCVFIIFEFLVLCGISFITGSSSEQKINTACELVSRNASVNNDGVVNAHYDSQNINQSGSAKTEKYLRDCLSLSTRLSRNGVDFVDVYAVSKEPQTFSFTSASGNSGSFKATIIATPTTGYLSQNEASIYYNFYDAISLERMFRYNQDWIAEGNLTSTHCSEKLAKYLYSQLIGPLENPANLCQLLYPEAGVKFDIFAESFGFQLNNIFGDSDLMANRYRTFTKTYGDNIVYIPTTCDFFQKNISNFLIGFNFSSSPFENRHFLVSSLPNSWEIGDSFHITNNQELASRMQANYNANSTHPLSVGIATLSTTPLSMLTLVYYYFRIAKNDAIPKDKGRVACSICVLLHLSKDFWPILFFHMVGTIIRNLSPSFTAMAFFNGTAFFITFFLMIIASLELFLFAGKKNEEKQ